MVGVYLNATETETDGNAHFALLRIWHETIFFIIIFLIKVKKEK